MLVIGGGITGAGIISEATRRGLKALLLEAGDFASGTSSRSSKLVHGGLRYLRNGQVGLTRESVLERERLLREGAGLVSELGFWLTSFSTDKTPGWVMGLGLAVYDVLAGKWAHNTETVESLLRKCPSLTGSDLKGGYHYIDAQTDDARLTLRVLRESVRRGAEALNYAKVIELLRDQNGQVRGVVVEDQSPEHRGRTFEIKAKVVISATGPWADELRGRVGATPKLRRIRGSHLTISHARLPVPEAVCMIHPRDNRAIFAIPWEGSTIYGTTDVDHKDDAWSEPAIGSSEVEYLLEGIRHAFPSCEISERDVLSSWAGVRPVIDTGKADPSKESREHTLWRENGLLTVTGGKLTTFRIMARDALKAVGSDLPAGSRKSPRARILDENPDAPSFPEDMDGAARLRLLGRHGSDVVSVLKHREHLTPIGESPALWSELLWAAEAEGVVHLEDLLLRRVRLGFTVEGGGAAEMEKIRKLAQPVLGWSDARWEQELAAYTNTFARNYSIKGAR